MCQPKVLEGDKTRREMGRDCRKSVFVNTKARVAKNTVGIETGMVQASLKL